MQAITHEREFGSRATTIGSPAGGVLAAMPGRQSWTQNRLLAALPDEEYSRLSPMLEWGRWPAGMVMQNSGFAAKHVYFPVSGIVSVMCTTECGAGVEVAMVGNEGLVGIGTFLGGEPAASRAEVQFAAYGYRIPAIALQRRFDDGGALRSLFLRYTQAFITQAAQSVVCTRCHGVEQRLCGWLLSSLDRLPSDQLPVPHCRIAAALGVRREAITRAATNLHRAGILDRGRAMICVLDREGLESRACECYATVKRSIAGLMSSPRTGGRISASPFRFLRLPEVDRGGRNQTWSRGPAP